MRHIFWRGVEAGVGAGLVVSGLLVGWVIWDQSKTKGKVPQSMFHCALCDEPTTLDSGGEFHLRAAHGFTEQQARLAAEQSRYAHGLSAWREMAD